VPDEPDADIHGDGPAAAATSAICDRKELASVAFERTRMPMVVTDARKSDNHIVLANKAFLELTGYSSDELLGRNCRLLQGKGTSPTAVAQLRLAITERRETSVEILNYRRDGSPFWNQLHISPIEDDAGEVAYFFASQIDVSEFRKVQALEASEHRLLMEVDHRAKNVLAVVDSVVRLSRADDPARYAAAVQQRVQALSVAHSLLAERGWKPVELRDVIIRQIDRFTTSRITVEGPIVVIPAETVQPLALVIHELATNAAVHGALAQPDGRVFVSWESIDGEGGFRMVWRETGSVQSSGDRTPGFGSLMMKAMIEKQLGGRLGRRWRDDGVEIALELPAPA
jgi:PAS domain S-box-containing protein